MSYQQTVYHWMVRHPDPVSLREIVRGTGLPYRVVSFSLLRLHKRMGIVKPTGPASKVVKWYVVDDSLIWIPDCRGKAKGSIEALAAASKHRHDMAADKHCKAIVKRGKSAPASGGSFAPCENVTAA